MEKICELQEQLREEAFSYIPPQSKKNSVGSTEAALRLTGHERYNGEELWSGSSRTISRARNNEPDLSCTLQISADLQEAREELKKLPELQALRRISYESQGEPGGNIAPRKRSLRSKRRQPRYDSMSCSACQIMPYE